MELYFIRTFCIKFSFTVTVQSRTQDSAENFKLRSIKFLLRRIKQILFATEIFHLCLTFLITEELYLKFFIIYSVLLFASIIVTSLNAPDYSAMFSFKLSILCIDALSPVFIYV